MGLFDFFSGGAADDLRSNNNAAISQFIGTGTDAINTNYGKAQGLLGTTRAGGDALAALLQGYRNAQSTVAGNYDNAQDILQSYEPAIQRTINQGNSAARGDVLQGFAGGRDALQSGFTGADRTLARTGSQLNRTIGQGASQARADLSRGFADQNGLLRQATATYDPLVSQGGAAYAAYNDAIGASGTAGNDRALKNFQGSLGYRAGLDEGLQDVMRSAAARGQLAGGNTSQDLFDHAADFQNRQSQAYIDNLANGSQFYTTGLAGRAAGLGAQADAAATRGGALANLRQQVTGQRLAAQQGIGTARAGLQSDRGNALAALSTGQGAALGGLDQATAGQRINTLTNLGQQRAGLAQGQGAALGNLYNSYGGNVAGVYGSGASLYGNQGNQLANLNIAGMKSTVDSNNAAAQLQQQASGNLWGGIFGLGSSLLGGVGRSGGLGSLFG